MTRRYLSLGLATLANASQVSTRVVIGPLVPALLLTFGTTESVVGAVLTGMWAMFALAHYPSGVLAERYGERAVILAALAATVGGSLLLALAPSFAWFAGAALVLGAGTGLYFVVGTGFVANRYPARTGRMLGLHSTGGSLAGLIVPVVAVALLTAFSWRVAVAATSGLALVAAVSFAAGVRATPPTRPDVPVLVRLRPSVRLGVLREPGVGLPLAVTVVAAFAWQAGLSFVPTFLVVYHGFAEGTAAALYSLLFVANTVGMPLVGSLADRVGSPWAIGTTLVASLVGYATLVALSWWPAVVGGVCAVGVGMSYGGAVQSLFMRRFDADERIAGFGTVRTVYMLLGSLGSVVTGTLAEWYGWGVSFGSVAALLAVTVCVVFLWATGAVGAPDDRDRPVTDR